MSKDKIIWWLLLIQVFSIPLSSILSVRILFLLILLAPFLTSYKRISIEFIKKSWDSFLYLVVLCIGIIYSENVSAGLKVSETNFSFLAMPIAFFSIGELDEKKLRQIFFWFIAGLFFASGICFVKAGVNYAQSLNIQVFFSYQFTDIIDSHPTYLAYYLIFTITFGLYVLYYEKNEMNSYCIAGILVFFFVVLMLTGGRTAFISVLLVFSFFILRFLIGDKANSKRIAFVLVLVMIALMFLFSSIDFGTENSAIDDSWERFALWESAIKASPDILFGAGTGDSKLLNEYYLSHNMTQFAEGSYNAHNQFIQILFTNGILGLLAVLFMIARPLYHSVKHQNTLGVLVFFPFLIYGMTEVFLGRYQGVIFFALLHQCFIAHYQSDAHDFSLKNN